MSPTSNTSSLEPHNGSAYSYNNGELPSQHPVVNPTYSLSSAHYPAGTQNAQSNSSTRDPRGDSRAITNGHRDQSQISSEYNYMYSFTNKDQPTAASTDNTLNSTEQQQETPPDAREYQHNHQYYFLSATYHPQEDSHYDSVLVIDSIEDERSTNGSDPYSDQAGSGETGIPLEQPVAEDRSAQQTTQATAHVPTTIWRREYSPEERMRVGLPMWETEQDCIDYERHHYNGRYHPYQRSHNRRRS